uniref:Uncharacterized protein n=1 Tax=Arundo donax TaxID=35708 RepID=A0A0A8YZJ9_ARUDO
MRHEVSRVTGRGLGFEWWPTRLESGWVGEMVRLGSSSKVAQGHQLSFQKYSLSSSTRNDYFNGRGVFQQITAYLRCPATKLKKTVSCGKGHTFGVSRSKICLFLMCVKCLTFRRLLYCFAFLCLKTLTNFIFKYVNMFILIRTLIKYAK